MLGDVRIVEDRVVINADDIKAALEYCTGFLFIVDQKDVSKILIDACDDLGDRAAVAVCCS